MMSLPKSTAKMRFLFNWSHCVKRYGLFCSTDDTCSPTMVMSRDPRDSKMRVHAQTTFRHFVTRQCNGWILVIFPYTLSPTTCYPNSYNLTFMGFPIARLLGIS